MNVLLKKQNILLGGVKKRKKKLRKKKEKCPLGFEKFTRQFFFCFLSKGILDKPSEVHGSFSGGFRFIKVFEF